MTSDEIMQQFTEEENARKAAEVEKEGSGREKDSS
jgi:hypothetical protein